MSIQICVPSLADRVELFLRAACIGGSLPLSLTTDFRAGFAILRSEPLDGGQ